MQGDHVVIATHVHLAHEDLRHAGAIGLGDHFFALDTQTYQAGALDVKTKELLGLVASMVLRCDDCISYHVAQCKEAGVTREEFFETFSVGLVVGGSIVIPHLRRAVDFLDQLEGGQADAPAAHDHA